MCALDNNVEEQVWQSLFGSSGLLKGRTVIMASNSVKRLQHADHIIYLENATTSAEGNYRDLCKATPIFSELGHQYVNRTDAIALRSEETASMLTNMGHPAAHATDDIDNEARATASGVVSAVHFFLSRSGWLNVAMISLSALLGR